MSLSHFEEQPEFSSLLAEARAGSTDALGRVLMESRDHLLRRAHRQLARKLQRKVSPSDLVQETFLEAIRDFAQFHGGHADELVAWLHRILVNNSLNVGRDYSDTEKRAVDREVSLLGRDTRGGGTLEVQRSTPTPSDQAIAHEEATLLDTALAGLPVHYRRILHLRYHDQRTFVQIGKTLRCSAGAARKMWTRAVERLRQVLDLPDES